MLLHSAGGVGLPPKEIVIPPEADPSGVAWLTQQPIFVPDVERETRFPEIIELARSDGTRSFCVFPLTSPVRRLGALAFKSRETDAFRDVDPEFLQRLTDEVALAVDNALHQDSAEEAERRLRQERDRLGMLLEINNALVSNLDPRALFDDIAACLRRVVAHDLTALLIYDSERNGFRVAAVVFENKEVVREGEFFPLDDEGNPAGAAFRTGTPLRVGRDVIATLGAGHRPGLAELGIESACLMPMSARGRGVGTIVVSRLRDEPFSDDDVAILAAAAGQIAFAVANALAFQEIAALRDKLALEKVYLEDELRSQYDFEEIVGESAALKAVLAQVETVGPTSSTVLIRGDTGTGKEFIARAIHQLCPSSGATPSSACLSRRTETDDENLAPRKIRQALLSGPIRWGATTAVRASCAAYLTFSALSSGTSCERISASALPYPLTSAAGDACGRSTRLAIVRSHSSTSARSPRAAKASTRRRRGRAKRSSP